MTSAGADPEVEALLERLRGGEERAGEELFTLLYGELRGLARSLFRTQGPEHTLQPTAVLHEAWLKMVKPGASWQDRTTVSPQDIAETVAFLCSEAGRYITGCVVPFREK